MDKHPLFFSVHGRSGRDEHAIKTLSKAKRKKQMKNLNFRERLYFGIHHLMVGSTLGQEYARIVREDKSRQTSAITEGLLAGIIHHSLEHVPYYRQSVPVEGDGASMDPQKLLARFPILTKDIIRQHLDELRSDDLSQRKWAYNTSGGSTGEPVKFIQDRHFMDRQTAIQWLSFNWAGRHLGQPAIHFWGSERDILYHSEKLDRRIILSITNDRYFNTFRMTPDQIREYLQIINQTSPRLIVAYAQSMFDLARFAEKEGIAMEPQTVMTSAETLYPAIRQTIESVFHCRVFNRYGSREAGDIACECSEHTGMHVFPWGNYVEIVDDKGQPVPAGTEGNILVTNLNNYAMPLIRYAIGDRGIMSLSNECPCGLQGPKLQEIAGRSTDTFKKIDGTLVYGGYFTHLLFYKDWIEKFQIVQKDYNRLVFRIQKRDADMSPNLEDLEEIKKESKIVMGPDCIIDFEYPAEILPSASGKMSYNITEVE